MKQEARILPYVLLRVLPPTILILLLIWFGLRIAAQNAIQEEVNERLAAQALYLAEGASRSLDILIASTKAVAANHIIVNSLIDTTDRANYLPAFFESLTLPGPKEVRITMLDAENVPIAWNKKGPSYGGAAWLNEVMAGEETLQLSNRQLLLAEPILYQGVSEGAIVVEYSSEQLGEVFPIEPQTGAFAIINSETGNVIFSSDATLAQIGGPAPDFEGARWLHVKETIPGFEKFRLILGQRREDVFAPISRLDQFLSLAMTLSAIALIVGVGLTTHLVSKPLAIFIENLQAIRGAEDLQKITVFGPAEFQKMGESFNNMIVDLQNTSVSRDYVDNIIKSMSDSLIVLGPDQIIERVNPATCVLLGYQEEDLIGQPFTFILEDKFKTYMRESNWVDQTLELNYLSKYGSKIPMYFSSSLMSNPQEKEQEIVCVAQDISELKQAQQLLREKEERYRILLEQQVAQRTTELAKANQEITELSKRLKLENIRLEAKLDSIDTQAIEQTTKERNSIKPSRKRNNIVKSSYFRQLQQLLLPSAQEIRQLKKIDISVLSSSQLRGDNYDFLLQLAQVQIGIANLNQNQLEDGLLLLMTGNMVRILLTSNENEQAYFLNMLNDTIEEQRHKLPTTEKTHLSLALLDYQKTDEQKVIGQGEEIIIVTLGGEVMAVNSYNLGFATRNDAEPSVQFLPIEGAVLFSTNSEDNAKEHYGFKQLSEVISRHWQDSASAITAAVIEDVRRTMNLAPQEMPNNFTLLVLKQKN